MSSTLQGKVAIVTGASSGLGEAIAITFASQGARVTLCGRDEGRLKSAFDQAAKANGGHQDRLLIVKGDLNLSNVRQEIVAKAVEKFGHLDILVPNAGAAANITSFATTTEEAYDKTMDTNVRSVFFLIQQAAPYLQKTKGSIVIISSITSTVACVPNVIYPMSKAAIDHLARCLAVDLAPKGIRINTVNLSFFPTRLHRDYPEDEEMTSKLVEEEKTKQPLGNRLVTPQNIAEAVTFLASDGASFITGENIKVDGARAFLGTITPDLK